MNEVNGETELNPRSCIVTKQALAKEKLIRFVASPDGMIVPDLKGKLPGRGVWVTAKKEIIAQAVEKKLFARALKTKVTADENLPDLVGELIAKRALSALAMAKKAGALVTGFAKVDSTIRSGSASMLIHATDAADDGIRKLSSATSFVEHMEGDPIDVHQCWTIDEMSIALGIGNAVHIAAIYGGATKNLRSAIVQLEEYQSN